MNDTVAVALITSVSTLAGSGLVGTVSAWATHRQTRHQTELARQERAEQRAVVRQEARTQAYEHFLARADAAYRVLDEGWNARPFARPLPWPEGFAARRALDEAYVRVRLSGPEDVARSGAEVVRHIGEEFRVHAAVVRAQREAADGAADSVADGGAEPRAAVCPADYDAAARSGALRARFAGTADFVTVARRVLGGDAVQAPDRMDPTA